MWCPKVTPGLWGLALLLLWGEGALGAGEMHRLAPVLRHGDLCLDLVARGLMDERTAMTIDSGLPGTCAFFVRLEDRRSHVISEQLVEKTLRFDLWENRYILEEGESRAVFPTMVSADSALFRLDDFVLAPASQLQAGEEYRVFVVIDVQPLAQEDRERLRRYVSRNSNTSGSSEELVLDLGAVLSRLFGKPSGRQETLVQDTPYFRPAELEVEP